MVPINFQAITNYLFNFLTAMVASFLGSVFVTLLSPILTKKRKTTKSNLLIKGLAYGCFVGVGLCAMLDLVYISPGLYMGLAALLGALGDVIARLCMNTEFVLLFISKVLKHTKNIIGEAASEAIEEEASKNKKSKDKESGKDDGS